MGLLVLVLRSYLVFQNVYVTYKTLKTPPPSTRNNGKPSVRAMTQRKRDMKGCMAIWIVWCCLAAYESIVEGLISIFIPFYNEIKSVILVLFILARARGAEPIYLHVIRPFLKPYVSTLDAILDVFHSVGDFVLLVVSTPFRGLVTWWHRRSSKADKLSVGMDLDQSDAPPPYEQGAQPSARTGQLDASISKFYAPSTTPQPDYQVWHPPPSVYEDGGHVAMPRPFIPTFTNPGDSDRSGFRQSLLPHCEPKNPSSFGGLSDDILMPGVQDRSHHIIYEGFSEDGADDQRDSFYETDKDSFYETDEDSFNVTLRTPSHPRRRRAGRPVPVVSRSISIITEATVDSSKPRSDSDDYSETTGLSTVRRAPSLRTMISQSSSVTSDSDAQSALSYGRHSSHPQSDALSNRPVLGPKPGNIPRVPQKYVIRTHQVNSRRTAARPTMIAARKDSMNIIASKNNTEHNSTSLVPRRQMDIASRGAENPAPVPRATGGALGPRRGKSLVTKANTAVSIRSSTQIKSTHRAPPVPSRLPGVSSSNKPVAHVRKPMSTGPSPSFS